MSANFVYQDNTLPPPHIPITPNHDLFIGGTRSMATNTDAAAATADEAGDERHDYNRNDNDDDDD